MPTPSLNDEVSFIAGVNADGTLPLEAYAAWKSGTIPADYSGGYTQSRKWGPNTAGTPGGSVYYYFDPASSWTAAEQQMFTAGLALWSAVANISFTATTDASLAQITFSRGSDKLAQTSLTLTGGSGAGVTGGSTLFQMKSAAISIDTSVNGFGPIDGSFLTYGGYPIQALLHEEGHAIGLGHAGPYNNTVQTATQQYSPYDTLQWSTMSYVGVNDSTAEYYGQYPVTGASWGYVTGLNNWVSGAPTTWMPLDILAAQRLYGMPTSTPLSGGQVFGFNCNIAGPLKQFFDFTINTEPVVTLWDMGAGNTLDLSGYTTPPDSTRCDINLNPGTFSSYSHTVNSIQGQIDNICIAPGTVIDNYVGGPGTDIVTCNSDGDRVVLGGGQNGVRGGAGNDDISDSGFDSVIDGGGGDNKLTLDRSAMTSALTLNYNTNQTSPSQLPDYGTIQNIQHLFLISGSKDDSLTLWNPVYDSVWGGNSWDAGAGDDTATINLPNDTAGVTAQSSGSQYIIRQNVGGSLVNTVVLTNVENVHVMGGSGNDMLTGGSGVDTLTGGAGNDTLDGGSNVDTAAVSGLRSSYTITQTATGTFTVNGPDGTDTLTNVEYLRFDDQTLRLLPGTGSTITWTGDPSTYMAAIRDFDGNDLGGAASWKLIGTADVNGDGRAEHILFNRQIGRWAEVGTEADGLTYFNNNGWAGDTRVVGIYIDPLVVNGTVVKGSDTDSQRRFQNDLFIDNIHGILGQADYNHDGLQEIYFSLTDGTAYLHAYMHADGNIQYANYQSKQQVIDYLSGNGWSASTWSAWFPSSQVMPETVTDSTLFQSGSASSPILGALTG